MGKVKIVKLGANVSDEENLEEKIDEETAEMISNAIYSKDISDMTPEELDQLAILQWQDDPDVEFDDLGLSEDAGPLNHGMHSEDEILFEDYDIGDDNYEEIQATLDEEGIPYEVDTEVVTDPNTDPQVPVEPAPVPEPPKIPVIPDVPEEPESTVKQQIFLWVLVLAIIGTVVGIGIAQGRIF